MSNPDRRREKKWQAQHTLAADPVEKPYSKSPHLASGSYSRHPGVSMKRVRILVWCSSVAAATTLAVLTSLIVRAAPDGGPASIAMGDLKEWLTYIASDDLQGRAVYSA